MTETTTQRTARLLTMSNAQLVMHAQDLTLERDSAISDIATLEQEVKQVRARLARVEGERDGLHKALLYWCNECSGAEPSISVFSQMADAAIAAVQP